MVQWLRLHTSTAGGMGMFPGQETKIRHASRCSKKSQKPKTKKLISLVRIQILRDYEFHLILHSCAVVHVLVLGSANPRVQEWSA